MANCIFVTERYLKKPMTGYKFILIALAMFLTACSTVKEAHNEFRKEIDGFNREWARVILKKEPKEYE
jgi:hypothetical protein